MKVLVTGAAGYIGSILTAELVSNGYDVVALDNLKQGHRKAIDRRAIFVECDLGDGERLDKVISTHRPEVCFHLAAISNIEESSRDPGGCFKVNVIYGLQLLDAMLRHGVGKMVFSSTASVYGEPVSIPINEEHPKKPVNAYGESKLIFERLLHWYSLANGMKFISLRYFNAAGATKTLGEDHRPETHLIPKVLEVASGRKGQVIVHGNDYDTRDGSCVRDYIHVLDIARAHVIALKAMESTGNQTYNIGSGEGYSVLEVIETAGKVTGAQIPVTFSTRRCGDPAQLVATSGKIEAEIGWKPQFSQLEYIIASAWEWQKTHPYGYDEQESKM